MNQFLETLHRKGTSTFKFSITTNILIMFICPYTWKAFIANHPSSKAINRNFSLIHEAFNKDRSVIDCTNAAMGMSPGILLAFPLNSTKPMLFHHFTKAFQNPGDWCDTDEFFGMISWDELPLAVKLVPDILFPHGGEDGSYGDQGNLKTHFKDVDSTQLFAATDVDSFTATQETTNQDAKLFLRPR